MAEGDSYELLAQYQAGRSEAAAAIFDRYVERLVALARSRLSSKLLRRVDPEDVVQSAFRSFFLHARAGEFELQQSGDLWRLLAQIALHKLYGQAERHRAKRRSIAQEAGSAGLVAVPSAEPPAVEVVAIVEQLHLVLARLDDEQQSVLIESLRGRKVEEIAQLMNKSPRSVRRYLAEVRERVEQELTGQNLGRVGGGDRVEPAIDDELKLSAKDYVLERMLGAGGMGKVYRARHRETGQWVAVKALRKLRQRDSRAVEQFVQEAKILGSLRHPNVVGVHGLGRFPGGGLFIVMDFVEGANLQERLRRQKFSVCEALRVVLEVSHAVAHLHERGIVHADLKPGNVILEATGRPMVTDFGFARIVAADSPSGKSAVGGTTGYIAPEVYRMGQAPTFAADIYGLGALLWALVMGSPPDDFEVVNDDLGGRSLIAPICRRCLAVEPKARFRDVRELLDELERARESANAKAGS